MSFLDIDERIVDLLGKVELTATPITDIKTFPEVEVGVIEGALGNEEELHLAKELRERCKILIAWGDCAVFGGINCMRNFMPAEQVLKEGYVDTVSTVNPDGVLPRQDLRRFCPRRSPWTGPSRWMSTFPDARPTRTPSIMSSARYWRGGFPPFPRISCATTSGGNESWRTRRKTPLW